MMTIAVKLLALLVKVTRRLWCRRYGDDNDGDDDDDDYDGVVDDNGSSGDDLIKHKTTARRQRVENE